MGANIFSYTHRSTMCGLKKLASCVFPKSVCRRAAAEMAAAAETNHKK